MPGAGFATGTPWIGVNSDYVTVNAQAEEHAAGSVLACYKALIALRRADPLLRDGRFRDLDPAHSSVYLFERAIGRDRRLIAINLSSRPVRYALPTGVAPGKWPIGEASLSAGAISFAPWQGRSGARDSGQSARSRLPGGRSRRADLPMMSSPANRRVSGRWSGCSMRRAIASAAASAMRRSGWRIVVS